MSCLGAKLERTAEILRRQHAEDEHSRKRFAVLVEAGWTVYDGTASISVGRTDVTVRECEGDLELSTGLDAGSCPIKDEYEAITFVEALRERLGARP